MTNHPPEPPPAEPYAPAGAERSTDAPTELSRRELRRRESAPATAEAEAEEDAEVEVEAEADAGEAAGSAPEAGAGVVTLADSLATPVEAPAPAPETPGRLEVTGEWRRVSPRAITIDLVGEGIGVVVVLAAAAIVASVVQHPWPWIPGGAIALATLVSAAFVPRRIRSIGYLLREDDLLFRRGIMWQRFVAVPYGRMQLVDINRGPLARAFGLAELKFVTASPAAGVTIPGLPLQDAEDLRDHLVSVAESRRTGL